MLAAGLERNAAWCGSFVAVGREVEVAFGSDAGEGLGVVVGGSRCDGARVLDDEVVGEFVCERACVFVSALEGLEGVVVEESEVAVDDFLDDKSFEQVGLVALGVGVYVLAYAIGCVFCVVVGGDEGAWAVGACSEEGGGEGKEEDEEGTLHCYNILYEGNGFVDKGARRGDILGASGGREECRPFRALRFSACLET